MISKIKEMYNYKNFITIYHVNMLAPILQDEKLS